MQDTDWLAEGSGELLSSPRALDLNADGVQDFVFGVGIETFAPAPERNGVVAVDGATGSVLWRVPTRYVPIGTALIAQLDPASAEPHVVLGGRNGELLAIEATSGALRWQHLPNQDPLQQGWLNFYSVVGIEDLDADGVPELVATNGGDAAAEVGEPRRPGSLVVVSGESGQVLQREFLESGDEIYSSPVLHSTPAGLFVVAGSGGETLPGQLLAWPIDTTSSTPSVIGGPRPLAQSATKGFIAPITLAELTGDATLDIVATAFDGTITAVDGASFEPLWSARNDGYESYSSPGVGYINSDDTPDILVPLMRGTFPSYDAGRIVAYDGRTGAALWEHSTSAYAVWSNVTSVTPPGDTASTFFFTGAFAAVPQSPPDRSDVFVVFQSEVTRAATIGGMAFATATIAPNRIDGGFWLTVPSFQPETVVPSRWQLIRFRLALDSLGPGVHGYLGDNGESTFAHAP
jgi:outer membrane protein assembly factor BamB